MAALTHRRRWSGPMLRWSLAAAFAIAAALADGTPSAAAEPAKATQVEAAFVFNFTKFVEWPTSAFADDGAPLVIGILGDDPLTPVIEEMIQGEAAHGRPLRVQRANDAKELLGCHVVFIARSRSEHLAETLRTLSTRPILTVSDVDGFEQAGGMVQFYLEGTKLRFLIDPGAAQAAGLKVSAQLLTVGKVVGTVTGTRP
jgi:hypothetical protein